MRVVKLRKGLDLPVSGSPEQKIDDGALCKTVGIIGSDYIDLKPRLSVEEGDEVRRGQALLTNRDTPDVKIVSPVSGTVKAVHRGPRRVLESIVISVGDANDDGIDFSEVGGEATADELATKLAAAGLWTSFRTRPYSKVPDLNDRPAAIFVTAMDTEPGSPDAGLVISENAEAFQRGLAAIAKLSTGKTYLCQSVGEALPGAATDSVEAVAFAGPHPAGLPGTHIHFLHPPTGAEAVWSIWYQDIIAIGRLLITGHLDSSRVIALGGPCCAKPRLIRTLAGASIEDLTAADLPKDVKVRLVSGSVLSGRGVTDTTGYLGRYARQISILEEDDNQSVLGWIRPMGHKFAVQPVLGSAFSRKLFELTTNLNGGRRAMVPTGTFEDLMPQDYLPTQLLRSLLVMDTDTAQALGALELDEEDLSLVTFSCPAKYEYGLALRDCLEKIEKEG